MEELGNEFDFEEIELKVSKALIDFEKKDAFSVAKGAISSTQGF